MRPRYKTGNKRYVDEEGRTYRKVFYIDEEGRCVEKGMLYDSQADSRQQPKSLAYRLREAYNKKNDTRISPYRCRNCS